MAHQKALVVFVDALGPLQLKRFGTTLGFLGHQRALRGVLGYTSGALPTVLTGRTPAEHGRMCLFSEYHVGDRHLLAPLRWLGLLPRFLHERRRFRALVERWIAARHDLTGYVALHKVPPRHFGWLSLPERDDLFTADDIGGERTFLADARAAGLGVYASPWQLREDERFQVAHRALEAHQPDLAFLYSGQLDGVLHAEGNEGSEAERVMARIARDIDRARELMADDGADVTTFVVGDHGMADIFAHVDPRPLVQSMSTTRLFVDATMLRVWGNGSELARLRRAIESARWPGTWLDIGALRERGVPTLGAPYGNAMFVLDEGAMFAPSFLGGACAGMHGYQQSSSSCYAALASDRPIPDGCGALEDLAPLVRGALGLGQAETER